MTGTPTGKATERLVASNALVKATIARAKKARPKRQLFPFFRLPDRTTSGIPSMSTRRTDRREGVCDHRTCEPLETLVESLGLSRGSVLSRGMIN